MAGTRKAVEALENYTKNMTEEDWEKATISVNEGLTRYAAKIVNATEALDIIWLAFEEDRFEKQKLSNALKSVSDHLNDLATVLYYTLAEMEG